MSSWIASGSRVSITCFRKPITGKVTFGKCDAALDLVDEAQEALRLVVDGDVDDLRVEDLRSFSPTTS